MPSQAIRARAPQHPTASRAATSPALFSVLRLLLLGIAGLPRLAAAPTRFTDLIRITEDGEDELPPDDAALWIYLTVAIGLVLLGGIFAGLTIALMGQVGWPVYCLHIGGPKH